MPKKGHTEEQIIGALKQYESGEKVAEICRELGVSEATFYTWKKQYTWNTCLAVSSPITLMTI